MKSPGRNRFIPFPDAEWPVWARTQNFLRLLGRYAKKGYIQLAGIKDLKNLSIDQINTLTRDEIFAQMELARTEKRRNFFFKHRRADSSDHLV